MAAEHPDVRFTLTQRLQDVTATASQGKVLGQLAGTELAIAWQDGSKRSVFRVKCRASGWQGGCSVWALGPTRSQGRQCISPRRWFSDAPDHQLFQKWRPNGD